MLGYVWFVGSIPVRSFLFGSLCFACSLFLFTAQPSPLIIPSPSSSFSFFSSTGWPPPSHPIGWFPQSDRPPAPSPSLPVRLGILQSLFADRSDQSCCSAYLCFVGLVVVAGLFKDACSGGLVYAQGCVRGGGLACAIGGLVCAGGVGLGFAMVVWLVPNCVLDWSWVLGARCMELVVLHPSQSDSNWTCRVCSQLCPVWVACSLVGILVVDLARQSTLSQFKFMSLLFHLGSCSAHTHSMLCLLGLAGLCSSLASLAFLLALYLLTIA